MLIIFPLLYFTILAFILQNSTSVISNNVYLLNCPLPLQNQLVTLGSPPILGGTGLPSSAVGGTFINYTIGQPNQSTSNATGTGTYFQCQIQSSPPPNNVPQIITVPRNYAGTQFGFIPTGWFQYVGDTLGAIFTKAELAVTLVFNYITLPAQVSGLAWFNYVSVLLILMIGLGILLIIRS